MNLIKYNPFQTFSSFEHELNRLFDLDTESPFRWKPEVDIWETDSEVIAEAECAGLSPENLNVTIQDGVLTIEGERKSGNEKNEGRYRLIERSYGRFSRSFTLPRSVNTDSVQAEYKNGVVRVTMSKAEESKVKKIEIKAEEVPKVLGKASGA